MAFVSAAYYGVSYYARVSDGRVYPGVSTCHGRLFWLPPKVINDIRGLDLRATFEDCVVSVNVVEDLLTQVERLDWTDLPGFAWYDWGSNRIVPMPRHNGVDVSRWEIWDEYHGQYCRQVAQSTLTYGRSIEAQRGYRGITHEAEAPPRPPVLADLVDATTPCPTRLTPPQNERTPTVTARGTPTTYVPVASPRANTGVPEPEIIDLVDVKEEDNLAVAASSDASRLMELEAFAATVLTKCQEKCREWSLLPPTVLAEVPAKIDEISAVGRRAIVQHSQALAYRTRLRSHLDLVVADLESTFNLSPVDNLAGPATPVLRPWAQQDKHLRRYLRLRLVRDIVLTNLDVFLEKM